MRRRLLCSILFTFAAALPGQAQIYHAVTTGTDGKIAAPADLWAVNRPEMLSALNLGVAEISGLSSSLAGKAAKGVYAVFNIPLGGVWTDFELKASVANWAGGDMVYFYHSPDPAKASITGQVWNVQPDVFFTDSQYVNPGDTAQNQRTWRKQSATLSIADLLANENSVVAGVTVVVRDQGTINPDNAHLIWSYCRLSPTGYEQDAGGRSIWHPIAPHWTHQPISPTP